MATLLAMTRCRTGIAAAALAISAILPAACAGGPATATRSEPLAADPAAACAAQVRINSAIPPGADPSDPPPPPPLMRSWAADLGPDFAVLEQNTPDTLRPATNRLRTELDRAQQGYRIDVSDPEIGAASNAIDEWVYASCGFRRLDVVNQGGSFGPLPAALSPGPVAVRFSNVGDPSKAGFVLLLARVRDGVTATLEDFRAGRADLDRDAEVKLGAQPVAGSGYGSVELPPGRYLLVSPLGAPPEFAGGAMWAELTVG